jgi:hypothetical protein
LCLNTTCMSIALKEPKDQNKDQYINVKKSNTKVVNLNDLVARLKDEKKREKKSNMYLSAAAISAVAVFGIILTL